MQSIGSSGNGIATLLVALLFQAADERIALSPVLKQCHIEEFAAVLVELLPVVKIDQVFDRSHIEHRVKNHRIVSVLVSIRQVTLSPVPGCCTPISALLQPSSSARNPAHQTLPHFDASKA
jgi:hypothetical protein